MNHRICFGFLMLGLIAMSLGLTDLRPTAAPAHRHIDYGALG